MTEQQYKGESVDQIATHIAAPEFRRTMASAGITAAEAVKRLHAAAHRPELWKRMNRRPGRVSRMLGWVRS